MILPVDLRTPRLALRPWRESDLPAYAAINADPEVRRWFPSTLTREQSDEQAARLSAHVDTHGFGFWALELLEFRRFIGFTGLAHVAFAAPFTPAVEIGWRLARAQWGQGYATEAARAALAFGFGTLGLSEIVSFAVAGNLRSIRVMQKIGMRHAGEFEHPGLADGDPLRRHVLYRLPATAP